MILYSLVCGSGHRFDSWFRDSAAFDGSVAQRRVSCPVCSSTDVAKAIMAPAVVGTRKVAVPQPSSHTPDGPAQPTREMALLDESSRELRALLRSVRDKVVAQGHDVGRQFAAEARRIHDGEAPARQIYGQASVAEARDLLEDGIAVLPLPIVPDELN